MGARPDFPMNVKIFPVFHRAIDQRLIFQTFTQAEVDRFFTLYGVNQSRPQKRVTALDGRTTIASSGDPNVLLEYQLPWHDPAIQSRGFMETSCYLHLLKNRLHEPHDYVGVCQYDMRWTPQAADILRQLWVAPAGSQNTVYGLVCGTLMDARGQFHPLAFAQIRNWPFLLESYNRFFGKHWDMRILIGKPFTLWQTYLMPRKQLQDMAAWLEALCLEVYPWANLPPYEIHWGVLSGYTERAESLFVAARLHEGAIGVQHLPLEHDPGIVQKLAIAKEHYGEIPGGT